MDTGIYRGLSGQKLWWIRFDRGIDDNMLKDVCDWALKAVGEYAVNWWLDQRVVYFSRYEDWLLFELAWL